MMSFATAAEKSRQHWYRGQCCDAVARANNAHQAVLCAVEDAVQVLDHENGWLDDTLTDAGRTLRAEIALRVLEVLRDYENPIAREQREIAAEAGYTITAGHVGS